MNLAILNRASDGTFQHPADGWYHVVPKGKFPHAPSGMTQVLDGAAHAAIVNRFQEESKRPNFAGLLIDQEHFSYDEGKSSEAYGWIMGLQNRDTGTWAQIKWTPRGKEAVENGTYRFISPVWLPADVEVFPDGHLGNKEIRPRRLDTAGLTNNPNLRGMVPLSNRETPRADTEQPTKGQMKTVAALFGLPADADEASINAAATAMKNRNTHLEQENKGLLNAQVEADLTKYANRFKPESREKIKAQLIANRAGTIEILEGLEEPAAPASAKQNQTPPSNVVRLHNRAAAQTPAATPGVASEDNSAKQMAAVNAYKNSHKCSFEVAWEAVRAEKPELFETSVNLGGAE